MVAISVAVIPSTPYTAHVTDLLVALSGSTVAPNCRVPFLEVIVDTFPELVMFIFSTFTGSVPGSIMSV
ncbi:hypothetical protein D3C78_1913780 [compost metagenome]